MESWCNWGVGNGGLVRLTGVLFRVLEIHRLLDHAHPLPPISLIAVLDYPSDRSFLTEKDLSSFQVVYLLPLRQCIAAT